MTGEERKMARKFVYDGKEFPDPDPEMSVEEVQRGMAGFYGELDNASYTETQDGEDTVYEFQRRVGTKGALETRDIVEVLTRATTFRPRILELARDLADQGGRMDMEKTHARADEIEAACTEARNYSQSVRRACAAVQCGK